MKKNFKEYIKTSFNSKWKIIFYLIVVILTCFAFFVYKFNIKDDFNEESFNKIELKQIEFEKKLEKDLKEFELKYNDEYMINKYNNFNKWTFLNKYNNQNIDFNNFEGCYNYLKYNIKGDFLNEFTKYSKYICIDLNNGQVFNIFEEWKEFERNQYNEN